MIPYRLVKPLLFTLEAETAHRLTLNAVAFAAAMPGFGLLERLVMRYDHPSLRQELWGREFANPVGLAAGFDKDGLLVDALLGLGFGFVEVGTVTPYPQPGNPRPRMFRLPRERALINRLGFNNQGALQLSFRLAERKPGRGPVGVNMGKNLDTPLDEAAADYLTCMHAVYAHSDYLVINLSSPNTPGLTSLQEKATLAELVGIIYQERGKLQETTGRWVPLLVKIAPGLSEGALADVVEVAFDNRVDGLIATNTTTEREGLRGKHRGQQGGLSGGPLFPEALRTIGQLRALAGPKLPLVGVGGIASAHDAFQMIRAGASLVELYTGLVYHGPGLVRRIKRGLVRLLARDGYENVAQAVGSAAPKRKRRPAAKAGPKAAAKPPRKPPKKAGKPGTTKRGQAR